MTPRGRLRKAVQLLDQIDKWNDKTDRLPTYVLDALYEAQGLVTVTIDDFGKPKARGEASCSHASTD